MPLLTGYIIDNVIIKNNAILLDYLCGALVIITLVYLTLNYFKDFLLFCVQNAVLIRIRLMLFTHLQKLSLSIIHGNETGYLLARILNEPSSLNGLFFQTSLTLVQSVITLIVGTVVIFTINWKLALLSLTILPFFVGSNFLYIKKIKYWNNRIKEQQALVSKELVESLNAIKLVKLLGLYKRMAIKFLRNMKTEFGFSKKQFKFEYVVSIASGFLSAMGPLVVVWYGGHEVIRGNLSIGQLVAFSSLLAFLYAPTKSILSIHVNFQKSLVSLNRIFDVLNIEAEKDLVLTEPKGVFLETYGIKFENVSFSYNGQGKTLDTINLQIRDKEKIAIIGPTGAGKSTLVHLLARFYEPNQGAIFIGGQNIGGISLDDLRKNIGFVSQEDFLFSTTIYENIRLGNPKASKDDVVNAAKTANAYQFIQALPRNFDTVVGEQGEFLSGGQRQLISLARLVLKNPPILILDEPTSAIDSETEKLILESLTAFMRDRTAIIISHRLSTVLNVDRIIILGKGKISDTGTHEDLLRGNEFYANIFANQVQSLMGKQELLS